MPLHSSLGNRVKLHERERERERKKEKERKERKKEIRLLVVNIEKLLCLGGSRAVGDGIFFLLHMGLMLQSHGESFCSFL